MPTGSNKPEAKVVTLTGQQKVTLADTHFRYVIDRNVNDLRGHVHEFNLIPTAEPGEMNTTTFLGCDLTHQTTTYCEYETVMKNIFVRSYADKVEVEYDPSITTASAVE